MLLFTSGDEPSAPWACPANGRKSPKRSRKPIVGDDLLKRNGDMAAFIPNNRIAGPNVSDSCSDIRTWHHHPDAVQAALTPATKLSTSTVSCSACRERLLDAEST